MAPRNTRVNPDAPTRSPARSFTKVLDNYYAPARDRRSEQALQRGLSDFAGVFQESAERSRNLRREDEYNQGIADAMRESAGEELKGVRTGSIFRQNSSFYMQGLNEQRGKAKGIQFRSEMARAYEEWEGKNSDDPNDFRNFMNQYSGQFIESLQSNPQMLNAALPYINEVAANTAVSHTAYTNERLREEQIEASHQVFGDIVAGFSRGDYDEQDAIDALAREVDELYASGEKDARGILVDALILEAQGTVSMDPLVTLAKAYDQGKIKLSKEQKARLESTSDRLEAEIISYEGRRSKEQKAEYDAMVNGHVNAYTQALMENPRMDAREFYKRLGINDEAVFRKLNTVQNAVQSAAENSGLTDGQTELAFQAELLEAGSNVQARNEVLSKYAGMGVSPSTITREFQQNIDIANGSSVHNSDHVDMLRKSYVNNIAVLENDAYSVDSSGAAQTFAESQYNLMMSRELRGVDPNDLEVIDEAHFKVTDRLNKLILSRYPNMVTNVDAAGDSGKQGNAEVTGINQTLDEAQHRVLMEAVDSAITRSEETPSQPEVDIEETAGTNSPQNTEGRARVSDLSTEADPPLKPEEADFYSQIINRFTDGETPDVAPLDVVSKVFVEDPEFAQAVGNLASKYDVSPMALAAVMDFETGGSFDPAQKNMAGSSGTGLIQFMRATAKELGTSVEALSQMSRVEQMVYVEKYFDQYRDRIQGGSIDDLYMAVLWPRAAGKPSNYVLFRKGDKSYGPNSGLDRNRDGTVTKDEAAAKVKAKFYGY